jgi:hypothetical protein
LLIIKIIEPAFMRHGNVFESLDRIEDDFEVAGYHGEPLLVFPLHAGDDFDGLGQSLVSFLELIEGHDFILTRYYKTCPAFSLACARIST